MAIIDFSKKEKQMLLALAHDSIKSYLEGRESKVEESSLPDNLREKLACFVTLKIDKELRGCIGHLQAIQPLYKDVLENSIASAFMDDRFPPLTKDEFQNVKIEISVLSTPEGYIYSTTEELLAHLGKEKPGVTISLGFERATFLPSVWDEIPKPEEFLTYLCLKAGFAPDEWRNGKLEIQTFYAVEVNAEIK